jgi:Holliday junction resolvasome RuvABC DNA-binding subunit
LKELGYDQRNIDFVVEKLNPVDASEADKWLKSHRIIE